MSRFLTLLALLAGVLVPAGAAQAARPADLPPGKPLLFAVQSERGSLERIGRSRDRFVLTLRGVGRQTLWFTDRPTRDTGHLRTGRLVGAWRALGFRSVPPNGVISLLDGHRRADAVAVELRGPRYDRAARTLRFRVRTLRNASGGLAHLGRKVDRRIPARFRHAALFVDDATLGAAAGACGDGRIDLFASSRIDSAYFPARGQILPLVQYLSLFNVFGTMFGGNGTRTFGLPDLAAPAGLQYALCAPERAGTHEVAAQCATGSISLRPEFGRAAGWVRADGRTLPISGANALYSVIGTAFGGDGKTTFAVPSIPAPEYLAYYLCGADEVVGDDRPDSLCILGQVTLFATTRLPVTHLPADGRLVQINSNYALHALLGTTFGGDGDRNFALPDLAGPVPGTAYGVCSSGMFPSLA